MFINVASLPNGSSPEGYMDKRENLLVVCAGNYRLIKKPILPTYRPKGRIDYQIIYIVSGTGHFYFDKSDTPEIVKAGNIVFFSPKEYNRYYFYGNDQAEYYFIHFTGASVAYSALMERQFRSSGVAFRINRRENHAIILA